MKTMETVPAAPPAALTMPEVPPPDPAAVEPVLIGSILRQPTMISDVRGVVSPSDFRTDLLREIYSVMLALADRGTPPDLSLTAAEFQRRGRLEAIGGGIYLATLAEAAPLSIMALHYAREVLHASFTRKLRAATHRLAENGTDSTALAEIIKIATDLAAVNAAAGPADLGIVLGSAHANIPPPEAVAKGLLYRKLLTIHASPPRDGKSFFALAGSLHLAAGQDFGPFRIEQPRRVLYFSGEDGPPIVGPRLVALARGLGLTGIPDAMGVCYDAFDVNAPEGYGKICRRVEAFKADVVVFDVLLCFHDAEENDNGAMGRVMRSFIRLARETEAAGWILHHHRKGGTAGDEGDALDKSRGASCIIGACPVAVSGRHSKYTVRSKVGEVPPFAVQLERGDAEGDYVRLNIYDPNASPEVRQQQTALMDSIKRLSRTSTAEVDRAALMAALGIGSLNTLLDRLAPLLRSGGVVEKKGTRGKIYYAPGDSTADPITQTHLTGIDKVTT